MVHYSKKLATYRSVCLFKVARLLNPSRLIDLKPTSSDILAFKSYAPKVSTDSLLLELPRYQAVAEGFVFSSGDIKKKCEEVSLFWKQKKSDLPTWYQLYQQISLFVVSSASVERVMSHFTALISDSQQNLLESSLEAMVLCYTNKI